MVGVEAEVELGEVQLGLLEDVLDRHQDLAVFTSAQKLATLVLLVGSQDLFFLSFNRLKLVLLVRNLTGKLYFLNGLQFFVVLDFLLLVVDLTLSLSVCPSEVLVGLLETAEALNDVFEFLKFI